VLALGSIRRCAYCPLLLASLGWATLCAASLSPLRFEGVSCNHSNLKVEYRRIQKVALPVLHLCQDKATAVVTMCGLH
jgi:hypothetical protein